MTAFDFLYAYFMSLQLFKFLTMLFIPSSSSLIGHKQKLETISCLAQVTFLILCFLVHLNQAGVVKKRDTATTETETGNIVSNIKQTEVEPAILKSFNNGSITTNTRIVAASIPVRESSKELANNEIEINDAKKQLEDVEEILNKQNNETLFKTKSETEEKLAEKTKGNIQSFKQVIENLDSQQHGLQEIPETTTDFSNNVIKEEKMEKLREKQPLSLNPNEKKSKDNLKNILEVDDKKAGLPGKSFMESKMVKEESSVQSKQLDNSIENSKEKLNNDLKVQVKEEAAFVSQDKNILKPSEISRGKSLTSSSEVVKSGEKIVETSVTTFKSLEAEKSLETSTSVPKVAESLEVLKINAIVPFKDSKIQNQIKLLETFAKPDSILSQDQSSNHVNNSLNHQELTELVRTKPMVPTTQKSYLDLDETTTLKRTIQEEQLLLFEHNKKQYARSMYPEQTTTLKSKTIEEDMNLVTTFKPVTLSILQGIEENSKDISEDLNKSKVLPTNIKEKKPKFINDNSTNAQKLNLPNNAEAWSLAAMKSLPKSNITIATAQTHNQTGIEFKIQHNTSSNLNNNSEKNLLDWSQIMMNKELSTTTRNEEHSAIEGSNGNTQDLESVMKTTTSTSLIEVTQFNSEPDKNIITENSILEQKSTASTISPELTSTILSSSSYKENYNQNNNETDNKVAQNIKKHHTDTLTDTFATKNVDNNPFNTSLNIEPNLNEINLTSNQTKVDLNNNDVHTRTITTKSVKANVDNDVKANVDTYIETSTVAATTTTLTSTATTEATAVYDMTTLEQISSETTTVSTFETTKQYASLNNAIISEQQQQQNKTNNVNDEESSTAAHNELDNSVINKNQTNQYENIDLITQTTTTTTTTNFFPITTFRPAILTFTSTTSIPATTEQEVDQKSNEIHKNSTNTEQQSIIKTDLQLQYTDSTKTNLKESEFETTTIETITTTTAALELNTSKIENTLKSSGWENEIATSTSSTKDEFIYETTVLNLNSTATTQTTPKQEIENKNAGYEETTTVSAALVNKKFENNKSKIITTTTPETNLFLNTSTDTPVALDTDGGKIFFGSTTPTVAITTTNTEQNTVTTTTEKHKSDDTQANALAEEHVQTETETETTTKTMNMNNTQEIIATATATATLMPSTTVKEEETYISLLDDTTTTTHSYSSTISTTSSSQPPTETTTTLSPPSSSSTLSSIVTTKVADIYTVIDSTTTEVIQKTTQQLLTESEIESSTTDSSSITTITYIAEMLPTATTTQSNQINPTADITKSIPTLTSIMDGNSGNMYSKNSQASGETDVNVIIAITVSVIGVIALILLVGFLYLMRKRQKQTSYSQRCRPVSLDEYTIDNASVGGSMRKGSALRASKRTYGNLAFDDPALRHNPMGVQELAKFVQERLRIFEEFRDVPQITSRLDEIPIGCEDKNRYANVLPLPETRVILQRLNDDEKSEYINANYVTGPKDPPNHYIACQAPLESTVEDFWRMIWEQQSRVIIQATDLIENGVEKCAEYLPPSVTLDNHSSFGDFQITLQNREVKDKYAISTILLKHVGENATRELTHYWYKWPEVGVPTEEAPIIAMLLEARSSLISYAIEQANEDKGKSSMATLQSAEEGTVSTNNLTPSPTNNSNVNSPNGSTAEINGNISMVHMKKAARNQGPLTIHCSPGTGRTGTIIACDIAIRSLETPKRTVDIPQIVYYVRRGRASAILTKEQYEFIYKVANMYAAKITNPTNYN